MQQQYTSCEDVNERIDIAFQSFLFFSTQKQGIPYIFKIYERMSV